jgi:mannose-6-phosphate isomerase-like protein (cupin superfamily)
LQAPTAVKVGAQALPNAKELRYNPLNLFEGETMDVKDLDEMIASKKRNIRLFGTGNFRSWMLYFVPGDGTDMHYHTNPETFLVLSGNGVVKGLQGEERPIRKNEVLFLEAKDYYQITNTGTEPLVLFGNRSEGFGGPHIKDDGSDRNAAL